jgi:hypothetical protein
LSLEIAACLLAFSVEPHARWRCHAGVRCHCLAAQARRASVLFVVLSVFLFSLIQQLLLLIHLVDHHRLQEHFLVTKAVTWT